MIPRSLVPPSAVFTMRVRSSSDSFSSGGGGAVADVARLGLDVGFPIHLPGAVGKLDDPFFIVDADVYDVRQLADVVDDLVDVVPAVQHHGVVCPQADRGGQTVGAVDDVLHHLLLLVADVEIRPRDDGYQKHDPYQHDQLGADALHEIVDQPLHGQSPFFKRKASRRFRSSRGSYSTPGPWPRFPWRSPGLGAGRGREWSSPALFSRRLFSGMPRRSSGTWGTP